MDDVRLQMELLDDRERTLLVSLLVMWVEREQRMYQADVTMECRLLRKLAGVDKRLWVTRA